jgi:hypothetical protein
MRARSHASCGAPMSRCGRYCCKKSLGIRVSSIIQNSDAVANLIQLFVRLHIVVSRACFPTAPKRLLQQYRRKADLNQAQRDVRFWVVHRTLHRHPATSALYPLVRALEGRRRTLVREKGCCVLERILEIVPRGARADGTYARARFIAGRRGGPHLLRSTRFGQGGSWMPVDARIASLEAPDTAQSSLALGLSSLWCVSSSASIHWRMSVALSDNQAAHVC